MQPQCQWFSLPESVALIVTSTGPVPELQGRATPVRLRPVKPEEVSAILQTLVALRGLSPTPT